LSLEEDPFAEFVERRVQCLPGGTDAQQLWRDNLDEKPATIWMRGPVAAD
jgi:hypothetical protein